MARKVKEAESEPETTEESFLPSKLLAWYDENGRDLPWRVRGAHPNPYLVWVSEIMLQQTTVQTVIPYFHRFTDKFPTIESLASADIEEVLLLWQGLGYYTRAKKLHECAKAIVTDYNGIFPETYSELIKLPGIGPYTAASISSLAFDKPEAVVDGNVIRVIARLYSMTDPVDQIKPEIVEKAQHLMPQKRAADYTSAIMDLGATVCTPKNPKCKSCPFNSDCCALKDNLVTEIPKIVKLEKVKKSGPLFWVENESGCVYIRKRTENGLLSGLFEFPWSAGDLNAGKTEPDFPFAAGWTFTNKSVKHVFTHIQLSLEIYQTKIDNKTENSSGFKNFKNKTGGIFVAKENFKDYPFSTLMKKVIAEMEKADEMKNKKAENKTLSDF
ncbi:A/G-specific adenine glycosylase [Methanolapillus millepedarum]|uniref:Adenine DNA glycosylase n=1 Tax=Methanolapillus millepedarum TaxID=3028296 RepID=A0AA96V4F6_9EURY|nr:Endonuclease III [Methanosarcinaceae archaeon Ac7]